MNQVFNMNKIDKAQELISGLNLPKNVEVKRVKRDKGLIERTDKNNKIIIVEDNRQIICG